MNDETPLGEQQIDNLVIQYTPSSSTSIYFIKSADLAIMGWVQLTQE